MKKTNLFFILFVMAAVCFSSCKKDDETTNDNNTSTLPDAVFSMNVTGAESHSISFTLPANVASDHAINGSLPTSQELLLVNASTLPITWQFGLISDMASMTEGTYDIKVGMSGFTNPDQSNSYIATAGTITITKASLFQNVASIADWFIDGNFTGTYQDNNTPPNQVTIAGSFSGINIKVQ